MLDTLITCLKVVKNYTGMKPLLLLTAAAWVYLFIKEKNKTNRVMFVYMPLAILLIVVCPITYKVFELTHLDTAIYYRILWIIPIGLVTCYAVVKVGGKSMITRIISLVLAAVLMVLCGSYVYSSPHMYKAENEYAIPADTISVITRIRQDNNHQRITVLLPSVLTIYARQYDADICMPYGREMFDINNDYSIPIYEEFENKEIINMDSLIEQCRIFNVEYIVFYAGQQTDVTPDEAGLTYVDTIGNYIIYKDPYMEQLVKEWNMYYSDGLNEL